MAKREVNHAKYCLASVPQATSIALPTASGTNSHPRSEHFTSSALCFRCSAAKAAKAANPAVTHASVKVLGLAKMSKAAGVKPSWGQEHQQLVYDGVHVQDHSLLPLGRLACKTQVK